MEEPQLEAVKLFHPWMKTSLDMTLEIAGLWNVPAEIYVMDDVTGGLMEEIRQKILTMINENPEWELVSEEMVLPTAINDAPDAPDGSDDEFDTDEHWDLVMTQVVDDDDDDEVTAAMRARRKKGELPKQTVHIRYYYDIDVNDGYWPDAITDINVLINSRQYFNTDDDMLDLVKERIARRAELYVAKDLLDTWEEPTISPEDEVNGDDAKSIYDNLLFREAEYGDDGVESQPALYALGNLNAYI